MECGSKRHEFASDTHGVYMGMGQRRFNGIRGIFSDT